MTDLLNTKQLVKKILTDDSKARNNDNYLYYKIIFSTNPKVDSISAVLFFKTFNMWDVPAYETVRRTRQKLQAEFPELRASEDVEGHRMINEGIFRDFARGN